MSGSIAVVGATGLVGREALSILAERGVPAGCVHAIASERRAGEGVTYGGESLTIESLGEVSFEGVGVAIFCATCEVARAHAPRAIEAGAFVVDNSSAFRLKPGVPLVVPEINADALKARPRLAANPNCSTIILLASLEPLRRCFGIAGIDLATYQAISGAGLAALEELNAQTRSLAAGEPITPAYFGEPCAGNVFSHDSEVEILTGVNGEERKIIEETRKIWCDRSLRISPTCVRVPVERAHTQAITVELGRTAGEAEVRACLARAPGLCVVDDRRGNGFPTPAKATGRDEILVGRIRPDPGTPVDDSGRAKRWCLLVSADQLRKGAALNAIQIAEILMNPARERALCVGEAS
ncbi:MAG: aspartate-semialdehyde dehydrogenase [Phycisphaerales bacterium]|nr:aspartate-semialdehyde dehydrogenase [Phycisphaerales bacterium]MCB9837512.1 aspartate-semialdehyde dehydrogenase [Phycisphaera sp.]